LYRVRTEASEWLVHLEAQTHYRTDVPDRLCRYGVSLALKYGLPIETVLVMLVESNTPAEVQETHRMEFGSVSIASKYRVVKLWELDGEAVFAVGRQRLLPWVILMRSSSALLRRVARAIVELRNIELAAQFRVLGGLRYDKDDIADLLGRAGFMLSEEIIKESSFYRDILAEGLEKGVEKGLAEGRAVEARRSVVQVVAIQFPDVEISGQHLAGLSLEELETLHDRLLMAEDSDAARRELGNCIE
jgi:predicted transposase YdaD